MHMLWFAANVICVSCFPFHLQVELKSAIPLDKMRAVPPLQPCLIPQLTLRVVVVWELVERNLLRNKFANSLLAASLSRQQNAK